MPSVYTTPDGLRDGKQALSKNEHYFSRALGNFKDNEPLVDRICDGCQKVCSQLEDVLAHNSPEAFFREIIGRVGSTKHNKKNIFYDPTFGIPPLGICGKHPGHNFELLWEWKGKGGCAPMSQLVSSRRMARLCICRSALVAGLSSESQNCSRSAK